MEVRHAHAKNMGDRSSVGGLRRERARVSAARRRCQRSAPCPAPRGESAARPEPAGHLGRGLLALDRSSVRLDPRPLGSSPCRRGVGRPKGHHPQGRPLRLRIGQLAKRQFLYPST